ncbi:MAG: 50S ribosomal protein L24 [Armatimonadota bacterium]|nr:50S ribosomal protein L24 [bacterium]MDW8321918.1 50S ribosomal protein L24 [Armatimonadota bacterium]
MKIRKDDLVEVIAGKDRGKRGKVIRTLPRENRVVVDGVNQVIRHQKPRSVSRATPQTQTGRIVKAAPLHVSKVMLVCPRCNERTRIAISFTPDKKRVRTCKKCKEYIDSV